MIRYEFYDFKVKDSNIHPNDILVQEKELASQFIAENQITSHSNNFLFKRKNLSYSLDSDKNLKLDAEISQDIVHKYFQESELAKFRASEEYQSNVTNLRSHIWKSYVDWIEGRCFRYLGKKENLTALDIGSRNVGWIELLRNSPTFSSLSLKNCLPPIKCEDLPKTNHNVVIALDAIQRETNPEEFLSGLRNNLNDDGILILSFRSGTGFDILALKSSNESIFPLDHIFLPSIAGIKNLLAKTGFEIKEVTTPGQLDAEIVKKSVELGHCTDPLITHLVDMVPIEELQTFIQKNNLSSHVRLVAQKKA